MRCMESSRHWNSYYEASSFAFVFKKRIQFVGATWKTIRVFISSTFSDMHAERDYLVKVIFPELRQRLEKHRIHLVDIDLRWGVTKEQADNDMALDLCLQQIDQCRPFFVGILGQRYGYVPKKIPAFDEPEFGWVQGMTGRSITELEMIHGVLNNHEMLSRSFFYFRNSSFADDVPASKRGEVLSDSDQSALKLAELKDRIRGAGLPVLEDYPCMYKGLKINWRLARRKLSEADRQRLEVIAADGIVDPDEYRELSGNLQQFIENESVVYLDGLNSFGESVRDQLWDAIKAEYDLSDLATTQGQTDLDPLREEADYHRRFMESRLRVYVGREKVQHELTKFADGHYTVPCLVTGPSGIGKSSAMANFVTVYEKSHPDVLVVPHFIGASPAASDLRQMLHRFCAILKREFAFPEEITRGTNSLITLFGEFVVQVPVDRRVLFVLDAINQLDETGNAHAFNWLPWTLPSNVKLIASCIDDQDRDEPMLKVFQGHKRASLKIKPLQDHERQQIVQRVPSLSAKALDSKQINLLLENPATTNPLFLLVALEELRGFGSFEELNERIQSFPAGKDATSELFAEIIERLEEDFGSQVTRFVLTSLATARRGLSELELRELSAETEQAENLFPLLRQLLPYLFSRGELLDFYHGDLRLGVRRKYLESAESRKHTHRRVADYFDAQPDWFSGKEVTDARVPNVRKMDELLWQRQQAEQWNEVNLQLTTPQFLKAKVAAFSSHELIEDIRVAIRQSFSTGSDLIDAALLNTLSNSLIQSSAVLDANHDELPAHIYGHLLPIPDETAARMRETIRDQSRRPWFRLKTCSLTSSQFFPAYTIPSEFASSHANGIAVSPSGAFGLLGDGQRISAWRIEDGKRLYELECDMSNVSALAISHDERLAVSGSTNGEMRLWDLRSQQLLAELEGHSGAVNRIVFSGNRTVVSASNDKTLKVWDAHRAHLVHTLMGHVEAVNDVEVSADGATTISASGDGTIGVWNTASGQLRFIFIGHATMASLPVAVLATAYQCALDGHRPELIDGYRIHDRFLAAAHRTYMNTISVLSDDAYAKVIERHSNQDKDRSIQLLLSITELANKHVRKPAGSASPAAKRDQVLGQRHSLGVLFDNYLDMKHGFWNTLRSQPLARVSYLEEVDMVASQSAKGHVAIWSLSDGRIRTSFQNSAVCMSSQPACATGLDPSGRVEVRDLRSGEVLRSIQGWDEDLSNGNQSCQIAVHPSGSPVVYSIGPHLGSAVLANTPQVTRMESHTNNVHSIRIAPNQDRVVTASDTMLSVWDLQRTGQNSDAPFSSSVCRLATSPSGMTIVGKSRDDGTIMSWNVKSGSHHVISRQNHSHTDPVLFFADEGRVVTADGGKTLSLIDLHTGRKVRRYRKARHDLSVLGACLVPGHSRIAALTNSGIHVWDIVSSDAVSVVDFGDANELAHALPTNRIGYGRSSLPFVVLGDGLTAVLAVDNTILHFRIDDGSLLRCLKADPPDKGSSGILTLQFSSDGRLLVCDAWGYMEVWDWDVGQMIYRRECENGFTTLRVLPHGKSIIVGRGGIRCDYRGGISSTHDNRQDLQEWEIATGKVRRTFRSTREMRCREVSADCKRMFTVTMSTVTAWNLESGEEMASFSCESLITASCVGEHGDWIAVGTSNGRVHLFQIECPV